MTTFAPGRGSAGQCYWLNHSHYKSHSTCSIECVLPEIVFAALPGYAGAHQTQTCYDTEAAAYDALEKAIDTIRGGDTDVPYIPYQFLNYPHISYRFYSRSVLRRADENSTTSGGLLIRLAILPDDLYAALSGGICGEHRDGKSYPSKAAATKDLERAYAKARPPKVIKTETAEERRPHLDAGQAPVDTWRFYSPEILDRDRKSCTLDLDSREVRRAVLPQDVFEALEGRVVCSDIKGFDGALRAAAALAKATEKVAEKPVGAAAMYKPYRGLGLGGNYWQFFSPDIRARDRRWCSLDLDSAAVRDATLPPEVFCIVGGTETSADIRTFDTYDEAAAALEKALHKVDADNTTAGGYKAPLYRFGTEGERYEPRKDSEGWTWVSIGRTPGGEHVSRDLYRHLPNVKCVFVCGLSRVSYATQEDALFAFDVAWATLHKKTAEPEKTKEEAPNPNQAMIAALDAVREIWNNNRRETNAQTDLQGRYDKLLKENVAIVGFLERIIKDATHIGRFGMYAVDSGLVFEIDNFLKLPLEERHEA